MASIKFARGTESIREPLLRPLFDDLADCENLLTNADTQFARRAFVRAAFAFKEGALFWLKNHVQQIVLHTGWQSGEINVTALFMLSDFTYKPDKQGKVTSEPIRIPFLNNCAFIFRTAAQCAGLDPAPLFSDNGWAQMQKALQVRHRITHPKQPAELEIAIEELDSIREAHVWLLMCLDRIMTALLADRSDKEA